MSALTEGGDAPPRGVRTVVVEIATALVLAGLGAAAMWDSRRLGIGWGAEGPQSGYFPFWIGLVLVAASLGNFALALRARGTAKGGGLFVTWPQLRLVLSVLLPTVVYVAAIPFAGLYAASAVLVMLRTMLPKTIPWKGETLHQ